MIKLRSLVLFGTLLSACSAYAMEQTAAITPSVPQVKIESKNRPLLALKGITTGILSLMLAKYTYLMYNDARSAFQKSKDVTQSQNQRNTATEWFDRFVGLTAVELYITYRLSKECIKSWYDFLAADKQAVIENNQLS
jgi:hypothetical protein